MDLSTPRRSSTLIAALVLVAGVAGQIKKFELTPPDKIPIPSDKGRGKVIELTLEEALRLANRNNADLLALRLVPRRSVQDVIIARAFYDSEVYSEAGYRSIQDPSTSPFLPEIEREIYDAQVGWRKRFFSGLLADVTYSASQLDQSVTAVSGFPDKLYDTSLNFSLTQPLLRGAWSDYGRAEVEKAESVRRGSQGVFEQNRQDTLLAVVRAYWELVFAREDYKVQFQRKEVADRQLEITEARIEVRDLAPADRHADVAEVARRKEDLIVAEHTIEQREDGLRALLFSDKGMEMWQWILRPSSTLAPDPAFVATLDWRKVADQAVANRPEIQSLRANVEIARQQLLLAETDLWPQLDVVGSYNTGSSRTDSFANARDDLTDLQFPDWSLRLLFSYALGNRAARAIRDRAELELEEAQRQVFAREIVVRREVRDAVRSLKSLAESIVASAESVRLGESDLRTAVAKERAGTLTKFDVMDRDREWSEAKSRLKRNQADFRIAEAALQHVQGLLRRPDEDAAGEKAKK